MKKIFTIAGIVIFAIGAYCQPPQIIHVPANSSAYIYSQDSLRVNTRYLLQVSGRISYWRDSVPSGEIDADGGFVYSIPYIAGISNTTIDSINASIKTPQYLPCDGSSCSSIPPSFGCPEVINSHSQTIYRGSLVSVDKDYLEVSDGVNDGEFCPRNGSDKTNNIYWEGLVGQGMPAFFHINDGDGDYQDNSGTLTVIITRLEPIFFTDSQTVNFGRVRCNSGQRIRYDTVKNIGSPIFPGCNNAVSGLTLIRSGISGDTGNDGFTIQGLNPQNYISQGAAVGFTIYFNPKQMKVYNAVIHFTTNDPQIPTFDLTITGEGVQGLLKENPKDTLDFGDVPVNVTKKLPVAFINKGTDVLQFTGITKNNSDTTFGFQQQNLVRMPIGYTINDTFSFSPTKLINYFDSVTISSDSYDGSQRNFYLKGRGVAVLLEVDSMLDFGNTFLGTTTNRRLSLVNIGNLPLGIRLLSFVSGDSGDFITGPVSHTTIGPGDSLSLQLGFRPQQLGPRAEVTMIAPDGGGQPRYVTLVGNGVGLSSMTVTPSLDYGIVALGSDSIQPVVLRNTGQVPIVIQSMTLDDPTVWSIGAVANPRVLPGDSLLVNVAFAPLLQQSYTTLLHLTDDSGRHYTTQLKGSGQLYVGIMSVADTVDFGQIFVGDTASHWLPVSNIGIARLTLSNLNFTQPTNDFSDSVNIPVRIAALDTGSVPLFFHPLTPGVKYSTFEISDSNAGRNDGIQHVRDVVLTGSALPSVIAIVAVDTTYTASIGSTIAIPVTLQSDISAANATYFKIDLRLNGTLLLPLSIQPGAMLSGYTITMNEVAPGNIVIEGTGTQPISGTGDLFTITYSVLYSGVSQTPIIVQAPVIGNGTLPRKILSVNGKFVVEGQCGSSVYSPSQATQLTQNTPNPFSTETVIQYRVALPTHVSIAVYDALGRMIAEPVDKDQPVGEYFVPFNASHLQDGIYYCRMTAGQYVMTKAMMLMK